MNKEVRRYKELLIILLFVLDFIITGYVTCYLWNSVMAGIFGLMGITYWQGWALSLFVMYFKPKVPKSEKTDYANMLGTDIIYTLTLAALMFLLVNVAGV